MAASSRFSDPAVLARIKRLGLRAREAVKGTLTGVNKSPSLGTSVEFVDYREYTLGDDLKKLDWRVYARSDRYFIKLFEEESNLRGTFVLDASASMRYAGEGRESKMDYASRLVGTLSALLVEQRDAAGLLLLDEAEREHLPPAASRIQLRKILAQLDSATPERGTSLGEVLRKKSEDIPRRGLIFIVSDLLTDLDDLYDALARYRNRAQDIVIFHVLDPDEIELPFEGQVEFLDIEGSERLMAEPSFFRKAYKEAMETFMKEVEQRASKFGADYLLMRSDRDLGVALSYYLYRRARMIGRGQRGGGL